MNIPLDFHFAKESLLFRAKWKLSLFLTKDKPCYTPLFQYKPPLYIWHTDINKTLHSFVTRWQTARCCEGFIKHRQAMTHHRPTCHNNSFYDLAVLKSPITASCNFWHVSENLLTRVRNVSDTCQKVLDW